MPSKDKKRELYLAGSMAELQKKSEVKPQTTNARILVKSADTMFREAEKVDLQGDEERAFIMYMRYFNIVKQVKTNADYKKNKQYYDSLLGQKNQVRAIEQAEQLAASLKERYDFKEAEAVAQKFAALEASGQRKEKEAESEKAVDNKNSSVEEDGSKNQPSTSASSEATKPAIVPTALCSLLRETSTQLIIMDARWSADFAESHINHACCISVPQEALTPGTTVNGIENQLPSESLSLWKQRGTVDHIVLLDWSSQLDALVISSPLRTLKDALFVYDSTVIIKSEPLVLEGGYEQWLLFYPTLTTNSRVTRPTSSAVISSVTLLDFDYPEFEEPQPPKADEPDKASVKDEQTVNNMNAAIRAASNASTVPQFNRALKPRATGQSIGESIAKTSELNNARNVNLARDAPSGEGVAMLTNHLYPSFVVAPSNKKGEKNTNVVAEEGRVRENGSKRTEDRTPPPAPAPSTPPPPPPAAESPEEVQARARLTALEEKRRKEERALADIMRQKRHMEQDLKEMQTLNVQERQMREAHEKTIKEEEAERKRQAEVEKLRLERKKKELEAERDKDRQEFLAREKDLQEARERADRDEEERQGAQRAAQQHAEKLRQERAEKARQEAEKRQQEKEEQARQEAEKQAQLREVAARKAEEEKKQKEEEERRKKEEEERVKKEEEERRKRKEKEEAEEKARQAKKAEDEKRSQERENQAGTIRQAQEPKMIPSPTLPPGWEKRLDNSTRRYYYIDHNHGKTQWEPPAMAAQPQQKDTYKTRLKEEPTTSTRGGLSRSHSSPDIMKQLADEARMASRPVYDRASKPFVSSLVPEAKQPATRAVARRRDLNPVYGNVGPAMTGLRNLGNTCYMNSTVQCLNNTTPLVTYFLNDYYLNDINRDSSQGMHGEVVDEFAVVVKALWSGQYRSITPRDLKNTVGKYNPLFAGYQQQDSQEFLTFLLDGLHEGLNEVKQRPQIPDQDNDGLPDAKAAHLAWENHKRLHRSIIVELFQGQLKSTLMCRTCHKTSVTFQASMYISLPIPASNRCSLKDCLRAFLQPEMMTGSCKWKCPQCRVERDAEKKIDIWKLPHILLIGLNRFVSDGMWMQKKTTYVDFPINDLDLEEFTLGPKNRSRYSLYGVSNHYGTMEGGHYTAFCRNPCNSKWHKFDDQEVYEMSQSDVKTSAAFVLYYTSIPLNAPQFKRKL